MIRSVRVLSLSTGSVLPALAGQVPVAAADPVPIGQAPQGVAYVPDAVPRGGGLTGLVPLGQAGEAAHLTLGPSSGQNPVAPASVSLFSQVFGDAAMYAGHGPASPALTAPGLF